MHKHKIDIAVLLIFFVRPEPLKKVFEPQFLLGMSTPLTSEGVRFASKLGLKIVPILL